jgi:hypothetical protein
MADRKYRPWFPVQVLADNEPPASNLQIRKADAVALQAIASGTANEEQQKRAFAAILHISGAGDLAWMPEEHGGERDSTFAAGKQFVGLQLKKLTTISLSILTGEANDRPAHNRATGKPGDNRNASRAKS